MPFSRIYWLLITALALCPALGWGQDINKTEFAELTIHHSVFPSTALKPDIASRYNLTRSKYQVLINVAVVPTDKPAGGGIPATVTGVATNLIQQQRTLKFQTIQEPDAVYYIAPLRVTDEEVMHITLEVDPEGDAGPYTVKFTKTLYTNE